MTPGWIGDSKLGALLRRLRARLIDLALPAELNAMGGVEGWLAREEAMLLFQLARQTEHGCIVEVGSYRGRSTIALALGARNGLGVPVYAFDPHESFTGVFGGEFGASDRAAFYRNMLRSGCYREVRLINQDSATVSPGWTKQVALLWIDGDHSFEGVSRDFKAWLPHLSPDAKVVFDDSIDPRMGPTRLIAEILADGAFDLVRTVGKVTVLQRRDLSDARNGISATKAADAAARVPA